jgi:hypothetical protein
VISLAGTQIHKFTNLCFPSLRMFFGKSAQLHPFFEIGAGGRDSTTNWPIHKKQHYKHHFSLTAWIIFHKMTIIPSINPTSSSTFPNISLFCQSLSSTKLESLLKYHPARLSSTPSHFTDMVFFHIVHWRTF